MHQTNNARFLDLLWRHLLTLGLLAAALLVSYSRYGASPAAAAAPRGPLAASSCTAALLLAASGTPELPAAC